MNTTVKEVVLIISTGKQDIKIWAKNETNFVSLNLNYPRKFHELLLENVSEENQNSKGSEKHRFIDTEEELAEKLHQKLGTTLTLQTKKNLNKLPVCKFESNEEQLLVNHHDEYKEFKPIKYNDQYILHPAKLGSIIKKILSVCNIEDSNDCFETTIPKIKVVRILVFGTHRELNKNSEFHIKNEPVGSGELIARWLSSRFNLPYLTDITDLSIDAQYVTWVNFLENLEDFSGDTIENYPVHSDAVKIITNAIYQLKQGLTAPLAVLSGTGGMSDVKQVIEAATNLYFSPNVLEIRDTETFREQFKVKELYKESMQPTHAESLNARAICRQRILQGDYIGAWGAVAHLKSSKIDANWLQPVEELSDFFLGKKTDKYITKSLEEIISLKQGLDPLRLAFKVEAALQAPNVEDRIITEALLASTTFMDLALKEIVFYKNHEEFEIVDYTTGKVQFNPDHQLNLSEGFRSNKPKTKFFVAFEGNHSQFWREKLNCDSVKAYWKRIAHYDNKIPALNTFRNNFAHRCLEKHELNDIYDNASASCYIKSTKTTLLPLWNNCQHELSDNFINMPLTQAIFKDLGISNASELYTNLIYEILTILDTPNI